MTPELALVWCEHGPEPATGPDGLCDAHRAGALTHTMLDRARAGKRLDCGCDERHDHEPECVRNHYPHDACERALSVAE